MISKFFRDNYKKSLKQIEVNQDLKKSLAVQLGLLQANHAKQKRSFSLFRFLPVMGFAVAAVVFVLIQSDGELIEPYAFVQKTDEWTYSANSFDDSTSLSTRSGSSSGYSTNSFNSQGSTTSLSQSVLESESSDSSTFGFSVGGSKDVDNFRTNIENGYLPSIDSITYEGLFYEYLFETGEKQACSDLFCPRYAKAVSVNPLTGEEEYYLSVGLESGLVEQDFERKKLNLVVVLDISGSMGAAFDQYYYDAQGTRHEIDSSVFDSKMSVAIQSIVGLLDHLNPDDRLGIVLFDDQAYEAKPLRLMGETDVSALKQHILDLSPQGGTDMSAGMNSAGNLFHVSELEYSDEYENRIIFITDAMPNTGNTSEEGLLRQVNQHAQDNIYTTFIGVGVDFQAELIESISTVRGANYYSVHSAQEFLDRMDDGFDYMVTPLVFDLNLSIQSEGYEIEEVYGAPDADKSTGEMFYVNTLFPSQKIEGQTRGGIILVKLEKVSSDNEIIVSARYEDRYGEEFVSQKEIEFSTDAFGFDNTGIRKAILLARYADVLKDWVRSEQGEVQGGNSWEQSSVPLIVSNEYQQLFSQFSGYLNLERSIIGDKELMKEAQVIQQLIDQPTTIKIDSPSDDDWLYE